MGRGQGQTEEGGGPVQGVGSFNVVGDREEDGLVACAHEHLLSRKTNALRESCGLDEVSWRGVPRVEDIGMTI